MKPFTCLTQLSVQFQILVKTKMLKNGECSCFEALRCLFCMLINIEMRSYLNFNIHDHVQLNTQLN